MMMMMETNGKQQMKPKRSRFLVLLTIALLAFLTVVALRKEDLWTREASVSLEEGVMSQGIHPIRQITILGERNSGTRFLYDHISDCFNGSLIVNKKLTRYKHWFQFDNPSMYLHDTLVLAQFRNPYDWLKAMEHVPHHSPAHLRLGLNPNENKESNISGSLNDWEKFLTKPWTMPRVGTDLLVPKEKHNTTMCQEDFLYRDINSCDIEPLPPSYYNWTLRYSEQEPFYEMRNDASGLPYDNILELRTDKIRNFLGVANYKGVADAWVIQYEYLLSKGTEPLLKRVEEWTGLKRTCVPKPAQNRQPKESRRISPEFARHVRMYLNWTVEGWIGYEPEPIREEAVAEDF